MISFDYIVDVILSVQNRRIHYYSYLRTNYDSIWIAQRNKYLCVGANRPLPKATSMIASSHYIISRILRIYFTYKQKKLI